MTKRYGLRDDQPERIKDWLPGRKGHVGWTAKNSRLFVEAVRFRYRAGIPWHYLPERFGDFPAIYTCHPCWSKSGVWQRTFEALAADTDNDYVMTDSTIMRTHQHSAGVKKGPKRSSAVAAG